MTAPAASGEPVTSDPVVPRDWTTVFHDEFDGDRLDLSTWSHRQLGSYNPDGSRRCSASDESAVVVGGGVLELQVRRDPARLDDTCRTPEDGNHGYYLNGHVSTEETFSLDGGVAAARVRFQQGRGQHGAFWLQRAGDVEQVPGDPGASGAEIDVAEFFGEGYQQGGLASFPYYTARGRRVGEGRRALARGDPRTPEGGRVVASATTSSRSSGPRTKSSSSGSTAVRLSGPPRESPACRSSWC